jgi:hypothetical protein
MHVRLQVFFIKFEKIISTSRKYANTQNINSRYLSEALLHKHLSQVGFFFLILLTNVCDHV